MKRTTKKKISNTLKILLILGIALSNVGGAILLLPWLWHAIPSCLHALSLFMHASLSIQGQYLLFAGIILLGIVAIVWVSLVWEL